MIAAFVVGRNLSYSATIICKSAVHIGEKTHKYDFGHFLSDKLSLQTFRYLFLYENSRNHTVNIVTHNSV